MKTNYRGWNPVIHATECGVKLPGKWWLDSMAF